MRVALLSFWHVHAADYAREALEHPEVELVAVWDDDEARGRREAEQRSVPFVGDLQAVWADPTIDGIILTAATVKHRELLVAAAQAGKHIFTEKVLTARLEEAYTVMQAVGAAGVKLVVSLPRLYESYTRTIQSVLEQGLLGAPTLARVRIAHEGSLPSDQHPNGWLPPQFYDPQTSRGGALTDYGVHPLYLIRQFLGMPQEVSAYCGYVTDRQLEDNAVVILRYDGGALGVSEAGFASPHRWFSVELHGTKGLLTYGGTDAKLRLSRGTASAPVWAEVDLLPGAPAPFSLWVEHILHETEETRARVSLNQEAAIDLTRLIEAANRAALARQSVIIR